MPRGLASLYLLLWPVYTVGLMSCGQGTDSQESETSAAFVSGIIQTAFLFFVLLDELGAIRRRL